VSGLFLRLAAQASGQHGTTLHSPAALPYRGMPTQLEPSTPFSDAVPAAMPRATADLPGSAIALEPSPALATSSQAAAIHREAAAEISGTRPERLLDPAQLDLPALPAKPEPRRDEDKLAEGNSPSPSNALASAPHASAPLSTHLLQVPQSDTVPLQHQTRQYPRHSLDTPAGSARHGALSAEPVADTSTDAQRLPAPLLSPPAAASTLPQAPVATAATPRQPADEIHIHIGRIEVTAIQESAPSKRPVRKGTAPLSLDDYLARRKGDGR
jgi:hypothetical protein